MTRRLILISLFCATMQPVFCQDMSDARAVDLATELINKQKEQAALEQKIIAQGEVVEQYKQKYQKIKLILQERERDRLVDKSWFRSIYYLLPLNPPGLEVACEEESDRILNSSFEDCSTDFLTPEQACFFKFYFNKYIIARMALQAYCTELEKTAYKIIELKEQLANK